MIVGKEVNDDDDEVSRVSRKRGQVHRKSENPQRSLASCQRIA